jgi:hypothetical protein
VCPMRCSERGSDDVVECGEVPCGVADDGAKAAAAIAHASNRAALRRVLFSLLCDVRVHNYAARADAAHQGRHLPRQLVQGVVVHRCVHSSRPCV